MGSCVSLHRNSPDSAMKLKMSFGSKSDKLVTPASPVKEDSKFPNGETPIKSQWPTPPQLSTTSIRNFGSKEETFFDSQPWMESDCEDDFFSVNGDFTPSRGNTPVHQSFCTGTPRINGTPVNHSFSAATPKINNTTPGHQNSSAAIPKINNTTPGHQNSPAATPKINNTTPGHQNSSAATPKINKPHFDGRAPGSTPEPSPTKKKLVELFRESIREDQDVDEQNSLGNSIKEPNKKIEAQPNMLDLPTKSAYVTPSVSGTNSFCSSERTANGDPLMEKDKPMKPVQCCLPSLVSCHSFRERKKKMSPAIAVNEKA